MHPSITSFSVFSMRTPLQCTWIALDTELETALESCRGGRELEKEGKLKDDEALEDNEKLENWGTVEVVLFFRG